MLGLKGKARKCPMGTVSVCLKTNGVEKFILYDSDVENGEAKQFGCLLVIVTFAMYQFV